MIKAIITDFDGTLVDTFEANLRAYQEAFHAVGLRLTQEQYRKCFGYRFDRFMTAMGIVDGKAANAIRELKKQFYPKFFNLLKPNNCLVDLVASFHSMGGKTAIASTARRENLMNAINHLGIARHFDLIYAAEDVRHGKPSPEIYFNAIEKLDETPANVLIFEDSLVGIEAAKACGAKYIPVTEIWFNQ